MCEDVGSACLSGDSLFLTLLTSGRSLPLLHWSTAQFDMPFIALATSAFFFLKKMLVSVFDLILTFYQPTL